MKNIGICLSYVTLVFGLTTAGCQSKVEGEAVVAAEQDKIFKRWVKDTTAMIKMRPDLLINGLVTSQIILDDSLLFTNLKTYAFDSENKIESDDIANVVSLLREYNELPKNTYTLSFVAEKSFSPSMANGLKYDFNSELKNILVKHSHTYTEYKYIRGRLSGKKVFKGEINYEKKSYDLYDFIGEGDKIIKRKL
jgi:hypothetical protein